MTVGSLKVGPVTGTPVQQTIEDRCTVHFRGSNIRPPRTEVNCYDTFFRCQFVVAQWVVVNNVISI